MLKRSLAFVVPAIVVSTVVAPTWGPPFLPTAACAATEPAATILPAPCKRFEAQVRSGQAIALTDTPPPRADDRGVDILSYDLDLLLDPAPGPTAGVVALTGRVDIGLVAVRAGIDTLVLNLVPQLACDSVTLAGVPLVYTREGEELRIALPHALATAAPETVTVAWHGRPPRHGNLYVGLMYRRDDNGTPSDTADDIPLMFSISEPWSAHAWWPCKDHPADKALVSLAATVPAGMSVVANGTLGQVVEGPPGWVRYEWREAYRLPTYLVSVAASRYVSWSEDCRPSQAPAVPLEFHALERDRAAAEVLLGRSCAMADFLTGRLGPYPFAGEKYAQVEVIWGGAMEHTTATSIGQFMYTGDRRFEQVVLHELAHQWFGDSLTPAGWQDIWLNEGFATYAEALWLEHSEGPAARDDFLQLVGPGRHPALFAGEGTLAEPSPVLPNTLVYDKGAWVLHMLRGIIGDEAFFRLLRDYANDPRLVQGLVSTADLVAHAEAAAGRGLGTFFDGWLTTDAVPVLSLEPRPGRPGTPPGSAGVRLRQHQAPLMMLPVPLLLHTAAGAVPVTAVLEEREQDFQWRLGAAVDSVTVAAQPLLARWLASPPPALDVRGPMPNPVTGDETTFELILGQGAQVTVFIYDMRGLKLSEAALGFMPATEAGQGGTLWRWRRPAGAAALPAGTYWFEFRAGMHRAVRRATLVR